MNNIKRATSLFSPEPLLNTRRSSLPLSFDTSTPNGNSPLLDLVKNFNFSSRKASASINEVFNLPKIVCKSPSPPQVSHASQSKKDFARFTGDKDNVFIRNDRKLIDNYINRRSSCGSIFSPKSPLLDNWIQSHPRSKLFNDCSNGSPIQWNIDESSGKTELEGISPSRIYPSLQFPSLSPCFEDKPKQNRFPFPQKQESKILKENLSEEQVKESFRLRRSSIHSVLSPSSHIFNNRNITYKSKYRKNSFNSPVFLSNTDNISSLSDIQSGDEKLVIKKKSFDVNNVLGKGGFGIVKVEYWQGEKVAIKIIKEKKSLTSIRNEEYSLNFGSHLNLVETKAVIVSKGSFRAEIKYSPLKKVSLKKEDASTFYVLSVDNLRSLIGLHEPIFSITSSTTKWSLIISELCTSDTLLSLINSNIIFSDKDKLRILYQLTSALQYIHEIGYVHLDVKPSNCFISPSGVIKLGDFGCSCKINEIPTHSLGTAAYQAPEVLRGIPVTDRCDIYSLGITTWQMLTGEFPYAGQHPHVIIYKVTRMNHRPTLTKEIETSFIGDALLSLAERCWQETPSRRPRTDTLLSIFSTLYFSFFPSISKGKSLKKSSF